MDPHEAHAKMRALFGGCMREPHAVRDSVLHGTDRFAAVALRRRDHRQPVRRRSTCCIMTRIGPRRARAHRARRARFVRGLHSTGELDPERRFIMHFPEELAIESYRLRLRRQRAARQEVPRAAHRQLAGAQRGLARRAHADRRHRRIRRARRTTSPARSPPPAARPISRC